MAAGLKDLAAIQGDGTTLISFAIPGAAQTGPYTQKLTYESGTADRIKSKQTRQAVSSALKVIKGRLANYVPCAPRNGLVIFAGSITDAVTGKEVSICRVFDDIPQKLT